MAGWATVSTTRRIITSVSRTLLAIFAALPVLAQQQDYDILFRNARIVDGTGNPGFIADLALSNNRVAALGKLTGKTAKRTVAPGFIDIHNHSGFTLFRDGNAQSFIRQGVRVSARLRYSGIAISVDPFDSANER